MTVVGLLGAGRMGETLARLLAGAGHDVRLANSRGPDSLEDLVAAMGPRASAVAAAPTERNALFLAGDDTGAKAVVARLMRDIGGAPVDTGGLRDGGRLQASGGGPLAGHGRLLTVAEARAILARAAAASAASAAR